MGLYHKGGILGRTALLLLCCKVTFDICRTLLVTLPKKNPIVHLVDTSLPQDYMQLAFIATLS